jgi:hypothetical protein
VLDLAGGPGRYTIFSPSAATASRSAICHLSGHWRRQYFPKSNAHRPVYIPLSEGASPQGAQRAGRQSVRGHLLIGTRVRCRCWMVSTLVAIPGRRWRHKYIHAGALQSAQRFAAPADTERSAEQGNADATGGQRVETSRGQRLGRRSRVAVWATTVKGKSTSSAPQLLVRPRRPKDMPDHAATAHPRVRVQFRAILARGREPDD